MLKEKKIHITSHHITLYGNEEIKTSFFEPYSDPEVDQFIGQSHEISEIKVASAEDDKKVVPFNIGECEVVPSTLARRWPDGYRNRDLRPRLTDGHKVQYLLDSGSQCCVVPPTPSDAVDPGILLTTVNGGRFDCYGQKQIHIKIGRKEYHMKAMIAKVKAPILGWDFFTKYRLDLVWSDLGDLLLRDKKAQIKAYLEHIQVPHGSIPRVESVRFPQEPEDSTEFDLFAAKCVAAIDVPEEKEIHSKQYMEIVNKYPEILKPNFS